MTTQEKLQAILSKFNLVCNESTHEGGYFYIKDSDNNLVADFDTDCGYLFFCDYELISSEKMNEIEQEWLKVIEQEESEGVAVTNNDIKWGIDPEVFAEVYSQRMAT